MDPKDDEELETEANQVYGIRPTPFRISERYEDTVIKYVASLARLEAIKIERRDAKAEKVVG